jgi:UDP-4-amino-4,6-dideoxy-N-acetyl-beta-L-altrosamine transaminase
MSFIPYGRQWIDEDDIKAVEEVLKGDWITTGPKVEEFEHKLASYVGAKHAIAVNSGTSALDIAVACLGIEPGSEVITTPFTFVASSNCLIYNNLKPVFADIEPDSFNINPNEIEKKITSKTKGILYVDYAGQPCKIKELKEIAEKHELYLIEDAAHAIGAEYKGKKVGSFADVTEFSFHPVKHITTGEGGAITTDDDGYAKKLRMLRNHGMDKSAKERFGNKAGYSYDIKILGRNYRITDFQCALGISQLGKLEKFLKQRKEIVKLYNKKLAGIEGIELPKESENCRHAWHLYTILLKKGLDRDEFFTKMREKNIGVNVHYIPVYRFSYYKERFDINERGYPVTNEVFSRILTLPLFSKMKEEEVDNVVAAVKQTVEEMK